MRAQVRIGLTLVVAIVAAALVGPLIVGHDAAAQTLAARLQGPSAAHLFGVDELGRDVLARLLAGARVSLLVGLVVVHGLEFGVHVGQEVGRRPGRLVAGVGPVGGGRRWRDRPARLPAEQRAVGRVGGEQVAERRGARARLADDEERRLDGRVGHAMLLEFFTSRGAGTLIRNK